MNSTTLRNTCLAGLLYAAATITGCATPQPKPSEPVQKNSNAFIDPDITETYITIKIQKRRYANGKTSINMNVSADSNPRSKDYYDTDGDGQVELLRYWDRENKIGINLLNMRGELECTVNDKSQKIEEKPDAATLYKKVNTEYQNLLNILNKY